MSIIDDGLTLQQRAREYREFKANSPNDMLGVIYFILMGALIAFTFWAVW